MGGDLSAVYAKLSRAKAHAQAFDTEWQRFVDSQTYGYIIDCEGEPTYMVHFR